MTVDVTANLSDRFNNPVPKGTAVTFTTEGGSIESTCSTGANDKGVPDGLCTVKWNSQNPRPDEIGTPGNPGYDRAGRSTILATAIGEESFTDGNGNGAFDNGETFTDLAEPYLDINYDNVFQAGTESIYDFNNNSTRDAADAKFNGVLCLDTSGRCDPTLASAGISAKTLIIMSGSSPEMKDENGGPLPASYAVAAGTSRSIKFLFPDVNGNPMPSGTVIKAEIAGTELSLGQPTQFTVPCTTEPTLYSFTVVGGANAGAGTLTITTTTPSGVATIRQFGIN